MSHLARRAEQIIVVLVTDGKAPIFGHSLAGGPGFVSDRFPVRLFFSSSDAISYPCNRCPTGFL